MSFMLVVRVEVWPGGRPGGVRELGRAGVSNVSGLADRSDYLVVRLDDTGATQGVVRGHFRASGFWPLVSRASATLSDSYPHGASSTLAEMAERLGEEGTRAYW